jgi:hypothetical protein
MSLPSVVAHWSSARVHHSCAAAEEDEEEEDETGKDGCERMERVERATRRRVDGGRVGAVGRVDSAAEVDMLCGGVAAGSSLCCLSVAVWGMDRPSNL